MPPNTTNSIETISEQFQKLDLKALAKEKGPYQIYPKTSVSVELSLCSYNVPIQIYIVSSS